VFENVCFFSGPPAPLQQNSGVKDLEACQKSPNFVSYEPT